MLAWTILLVLTFMHAETASVDSRKCYDLKQDFYPYFSTKTAYHFVHGNITRPESNCVPIQLWMLARHGTRYPGKSIIPQLLNLPKIRDQIVKNHDMGSGHLCPEDLENLRKWEIDPNINEEMADTLTPQGKDDFRQLAKRLQNAFPELLQVDRENFNSSDYLFRSTDTQRTQVSLKSFARGLFGTSKVVTPENPPVNDTFLLAYKNCPAWESNYDMVKSNIQRDSFTGGSQFQNLLSRFSKLLGFNETIDLDTLRTMYDMCRFETAWYINRTSAWCSIFTKEDLKLFEYREDLNYYYCCGPGRKIIPKLGCQLLSDMFDHFKNLEKENFTNQPKGIFYFSHTVTLQTLMAALNIGKDSKTFSATTYTSADDRKYRTSMLAPFATNVIAVFYRCNGVKSQNKVMFYVAEKLMPMTGCKNGLCNWEYLKREFSTTVDQCNMDFCNKISDSNDYDTKDSSANKINVGFKYLLLLLLVLSIISKDLFSYSISLT